MNPQVPPDQGDAIHTLLALWKRRSQQAFPVDAMTINKCIRELEECIASEPIALQAKLDEANLLALSLQGQIVTMMAQPTEGWLIKYTSQITKGPERLVFQHNAIADYRQFDPNATVTELIPRVNPL